MKKWKIASILVAICGEGRNVFIITSKFQRESLIQSKGFLGKAIKYEKVLNPNKLLHYRSCELYSYEMHTPTILTVYAVKWENIHKVQLSKKKG